MTQTQETNLSLAIRLILFLQIILTPASAFCGQVKLAWTTITEPDIAGYRIFYREENGYYNFNQPSWEGSDTGCVITGLDDNAVYYFMVRSYNTAEIESINSNEVYYKTPDNLPPPTDVDPEPDQAPDVDPEPDQTPDVDPEPDQAPDVDPEPDQTPDVDPEPDQAPDVGDACDNCNILEVQISGSNDDAEERASGSMYLNSTDLELIHDSSDQTIGMRFNEIGIPQGATIVHAYVQFQVDEGSSITTVLNIAGEAIDNAPSFSSPRWNITDRITTTTSVNWYPDSWKKVGESGPDQRTPDISSIIQETVDRSGWSSGNALAIIVTGIGERVAESYDGSSDGAPLLHIEYYNDISYDNNIQNPEENEENETNTEDLTYNQVTEDVSHSAVDVTLVFDEDLDKEGISNKTLDEGLNNNNEGGCFLSSLNLY
jgi:hypothetical protein